MSEIYTKHQERRLRGLETRSLVAGCLPANVRLWAAYARRPLSGLPDGNSSREGYLRDWERNLKNRHRDDYVGDSARMWLGLQLDLPANE